MGLSYSDEYLSAGEATRRAKSGSQVRKEEAQRDTDHHNLAIIYADKRLQSILRAYRCADEDGREAMARQAKELIHD